MDEQPLPSAGMTRVVSGWRWLQGAEEQQREWDALERDFWHYVRLNTWDVGVIRKWKQVDEQRGEVILNMEIDIVGKMSGSLSIQPLDG
jgi:hypothetical protein